MEISDAIHIGSASLTTAGQGSLPSGKHEFLRIRCTQLHLAEAFKSFLDEIRRKLKQGRYKPLDIVKVTANNWRALLSVAAKEHSAEKLAGLFGELTILDLLLERHGHDVLDTWQGPDSKPQDFRSSYCAIEVKTSFNRSSQTVTVHGLTQLDPPPQSDLFIVLVHVDESAHGAPLDDLIERVRAKGADEEMLSEKLHNLGYVPGNEHNRKSKFQVMSRNTWQVQDDAPGLRWSQLSDRHITGLAGMVKFSFSLSVLGPALTEEEEDKLLSQFMSGEGGNE